MRESQQAASEAASERSGDAFGALLRRMRVARQLSQTELAERANVSVEAVSALERGARKRPHAGTIDLLGEALGLDDEAMRALRKAARPVVLDEPTPTTRAKHNLPSQPTSFVGREREIAEILAALDKHRLVTLVGAGGIGKTRTSLQVAARDRDRSDDEVWFVELAPLATGGFVTSTIAQAMRVTLPSGGDMLDALTQALATRSCLLVLDNCEHVIDAAASAVATIVRNCPGVRVLASSRQSLGIAGEMVVRLPSLAGSPAVALFVERARAADARFTLHENDAATVAAICERLDGIPLAIELAATRTTMFAPRQLLDRLDERLRLLVDTKRDAVPRQQTLRNLIDWSYDLLDDSERAMFRALGVFAGDFGLEAALAVAATSGDDAYATLATLTALADKSLVATDDVDGAKRFRLLESMRAYAREKLDHAGEASTVAHRHLAYYYGLFAESAAFRERTGSGTEHRRLFALELDDVRAAADFALASDDVERGGELLAAINGISWTHIGHGSEGLARLQAFRDALGDRNPALLARLCAWIAVLARELGRPDTAGEASGAAVAYARVAGDPLVLTTALARHANTMVSLDRLDAARAALAEAEQNPAPSAMQQRRIFEARANLQRMTGDLDAAVHTWEMLLTTLGRIGDAGDARVATVCLSECEFERGNIPRAAELIVRIVGSARTSADWGLYVRALRDLAAYGIASGSLTTAREHADLALRIAAESDRGSTLLVDCLEILALLHAKGDDMVRAVSLAAFAASCRTSDVRRDSIATAIYASLQRALLANAPAHEAARIATLDDALALA